jgi:uncharacterized DUF497 family protein
VEFEWDANKAAENLRKHKVSFSARTLTRREKRAYENTQE